MLAGPLNFLTSKKAGWRGGPLPPDAKKSFEDLKQALINEPVVAYPQSDRQFHLYVDTATGGATSSGGFCQDAEWYILSQQVPSDPVRAKILHQIGPHLYKEADIIKLRTAEKDLIILPQSLGNAAIDNAHGTLLTGHGGIDKTVARIRKMYYWPTIIVDTLLTGDPLFAFDPVVYEYVWCPF